MQPLLLKKNKLTIHQRILEYKMLIKFTDQNQNKDDKLDFRQKSWKIHVNFSALGTRSEKNGIMWEKFPSGPWIGKNREKYGEGLGQTPPPEGVSPPPSLGISAT